MSPHSNLSQSDSPRGCQNNWSILKQSLVEVQSNSFEALNITLNHTLHYTVQISLEVQKNTLISFDRILTQSPPGSERDR